MTSIAAAGSFLKQNFPRQFLRFESHPNSKSSFFDQALSEDFGNVNKLRNFSRFLKDYMAFGPSYHSVKPGIFRDIDFLSEVNHSLINGASADQLILGRESFRKLKRFMSNLPPDFPRPGLNKFIPVLADLEHKLEEAKPLAPKGSHERKAIDDIELITDTMKYFAGATIKDLEPYREKLSFGKKWDFAIFIHLLNEATLDLFQREQPSKALTSLIKICETPFHFEEASYYEQAALLIATNIIYPEPNFVKKNNEYKILIKCLHKRALKGPAEFRFSQDSEEVVINLHKDWNEIALASGVVGLP